MGWADQLISPGNSVHYYETVHRFMTEHTEMNIDDFYRLFAVGGMQHWCVPSSSTFSARGAISLTSFVLQFSERSLL